jgi:hypothetical protein
MRSGAPGAPRAVGETVSGDEDLQQDVDTFRYRRKATLLPITARHPAVSDIDIPYHRFDMAALTFPQDISLIHPCFTRYSARPQAVFLA